MKKVLFALLTIVAISACNSPQEITSPASDSSSMTTTPVDSATTVIDSTMGGDTMKRDTMRR